MKKKILISLIIFVVIVGAAGKYVIDRSMIFTGYAAKNLASGIFVAGRDRADLEKNDLNFSMVSLSSNRVDYDNKIVYSNFLGFGKQVAVYRKGLGVCLVSKSDDIKKIRKQKLDLPKIPEWYSNTYWPRGNKIRDNVDSIFFRKKLDKAICNALKEGGTRSILVAYDTLAMVEKYASGFTKSTKILGWSMSKSITNTLIGILQHERKIDINKPAPIAEWKGDNRKNITTRSLLNMTSGLKWDEDYGDISDATVMLYDRTNCAKYAIRRELAYSPDSVWYYSSGTSNILTEIVKRQFKNIKDYWEFPYNKLFRKISMYNTIMETDAAGNFVGSSYTYATTRDWARFGLLYLSNGVWYGDTIFSPKWAKFTQKPAPNAYGKYGSQFWLNSSGKLLPDAPKDIYFADGYQGQRVYIIPSKKLVIVRMGLTTNKDFDFNKMVVEIINSLKLGKS